MSGVREGLWKVAPELNLLLKEHLYPGCCRMAVGWELPGRLGGRAGFDWKKLARRTC